MNYLDKAQLDLLTAKVKNPNINRLFMAEKDERLFLTDGYVGYFIPKQNLFISRRAIKVISWPTWLDVKFEETDQLTPTTTLEQLGKVMARLFTSQHGPVPIDITKTKLFDLKTSLFYQRQKPTEPVFVFEKVEGSEEKTLVGLVMPLRKTQQKEGL